jgi:hypothetical protein
MPCPVADIGSHVTQGLGSQATLAGILRCEAKVHMVIKEEKSSFLNVDLVIRSKSDLRPLVAAFGKKVIVLHVGRHRRTYNAYLEVSRLVRSPESAIREFCRLIHKLPRPARKLWDGATARIFDIGISKIDRGTYWFEISAETLAQAVTLNAIIAVTAYGKLRKAKILKKARA